MCTTNQPSPQSDPRALSADPHPPAPRTRHLRNLQPAGGVGLYVPEWMLDLLLPRTDAGVYVQWVVMGVFWLVVLAATRRWSKDARLLIWGLVTVNVAWFMLRMAH